jgi:hypothetical protein
VHEWTKGAPKGAPLLFETFGKKQQPDARRVNCCSETSPGYPSSGTLPELMHPEGRKGGLNLQYVEPVLHLE